jgi:hypothetical protein
MGRLAAQIGNFLALASDQLPHVEHQDLELASYVGRRLDQAWRRLDHVTGVWLEERYQGQADEDEGRRAVLEALSLLKTGAPRRPDAETLMGRLLCATIEVVDRDLLPAVERGDAVGAAVASYVARRWFTKYRVLKWRWLEQHHGDVEPYRLFEA